MAERVARPEPGAPGSEPALLRAHPALAAACPRRAFTTLPTPVAPFPLSGVPDGALFVKRDDLSCPLYGGNKPRKLEFVIGAALARGARRLVTTGGLGTHHGLATTILGRTAGLATTLVLVHQPVTDDVKYSLLCHAAWGAELVYGRDVPGTAAATARVLAAATLRGEHPYLVATGGSSTAGNVGFVSAGFELAGQVRDGALPEPAEIHVAIGTGGTLAGLVVGLRMAGLASRVVGTLVTDILPPSPVRLARMARRVARRLRDADPTLPDLAPGPGDFDVVTRQLGGGYGAPTPAARDAVAAAAACGLPLETTYTGKCAAEIRERTRREELPAGPVLFWNTFNSVDVAAAAPCPLDPALLPPRFRAFLCEPEGGR